MLQYQFRFFTACADLYSYGNAPLGLGLCIMVPSPLGW